VDRTTLEVYEHSADRWARARPARYLANAAEFSARTLGDSPILDAGCGAGAYLPAFRAPVVALDASDAMLRIVRDRFPEAHAVRGDLERLPFQRESLGGAWANASYLHVRRTSLPMALADLHRVLRQNAPLELRLRCGASEGEIVGDDFPGRFFAEWEPEPLRDVVTGAGFVSEMTLTRFQPVAADSVELVQRDPPDWLVVRARRGRTLPDFVGPGMRVLVCGLNPSVVAADAGYGFAGPTNRFWTAAVRAGMLRSPRRPVDCLESDSVGMTDLVKRATPRASHLSANEYREGLSRVRRLVEWLEPKVVLFVGLEGWRTSVDRTATAGRQPGRFGGSVVYVMPSTSGANARVGLAELTAHMKRAAEMAHS
jgi:double-stranded uracil-DNA glycosylase